MLTVAQVRHGRAAATDITAWESSKATTFRQACRRRTARRQIFQLGARSVSLALEGKGAPRVVHCGSRSYRVVVLSIDRTRKASDGQSFTRRRCGGHLEFDIEKFLPASVDGPRK
jgi:hypothetical protein